MKRLPPTNHVGRVSRCIDVFSLTPVSRAAQFVPSTPTTRTATIHQPFINHSISMPYQIRRIFETNHFLLSKIRSLCPMSTHLYPPHTYRMTRIYCFLSPLPKELDRRYLICFLLFMEDNECLPVFGDRFNRWRNSPIQYQNR